jgi:hypothetical protein
MRIIFPPYFCIGVTFEMRTAIQSDAFIQLMNTHKIESSFISETEKGAKGKIAERQKESKGERASIELGGYSIGCKMDH